MHLQRIMDAVSRQPHGKLSAFFYGQAMQNLRDAEMEVLLLMTYFQVAKPNMLLLDLDTKAAVKQCMRQLRGLRRMGWFKIVRFERYTSRSGNVHMVIWLDRSIRVMERIALQTILGSDPTRERMNWGRVKSKSPHPILFISKRRRASVK